MKLLEIGARCTFILPNTGSKFNHAIPHLQVCITDPCPKDNILCLSVGTFREGMDGTCLIKEKEHKHIRHLSTVYYGTPRLLPHETTLKRINDGTYEWQGVVGEDLFLRICKGFCASKLAAPHFLDYAKEQWAKMGLKVA